jgi:hypothetical protein
MKARIFGSISCLCLALSSLWACHSSSSSSDDESGGLEGACDRVAKANSAFAQRCGETLTAAGASDYDAHQIARASALCVAEYSLPGIPDPSSQLNQCASALATAACNTKGELPVCAITPSGTLANGEPCNEGDQCSGGACVFVTADAGTDAGAPSCGQCETAIASGQPCDETTPAGLCANGGVCAIDGSGNGHCIPQNTYVAALGASCDQQNDCAPPAYCSFDATGNSGTCVASAKLGEACNSGTGNAPTFCEPPLTCSSDSICVAPAAYGEKCGSNSCAAGLYCGSDETCLAITYGPPGASCNGANLQCIQGSCPGFSVGTPTAACPAIIADGQPCDPTVSIPSCDTFAGCTNGICSVVPGGRICK